MGWDKLSHTEKVHIIHSLGRAFARIKGEQAASLVLEG